MTDHHMLVIVGTGFSGLGMAIRLMQEGEHDFVLLERAGGLAFLRFAAENRVAYELLYEGRFSDAAQNVRRRQAALILELMREIAPDDVDPRELEVAAHAVNAAYEGVAHWMWEHPESDVEELADWTVELLLPGLRRFT